jgi:hypothetical protein
VKVQILYLDTTDDQVSARDKLAWIQAQRALLVWPRRGSVLTSRLDLRLVARAASHRGTALGLVTHDPVVRDHAAELGIPVFDSLDDLPEERWHAARDGRRRRPTPRGTHADLAELRRAVRDQAVDRPSLSAPARWLVFVLALAAVLALLVFVVPSADIVLTPKTQRQTLDLTLVLDPAAAEATLEGRLPARRVETTLSDELRTPTTGFALAPSGSAKGTVVFTNLTGDAMTIPAGTGVRSGEQANSIRFVTLEAANLKAEEGAQATVDVEAAEPGPSGNLPSGALDAVEGPIGLLVSATNPERTSGGRSGPQAGVSARDLQDLEVEVRRLLMSHAEHGLADQLRDDEVLSPASITISQVLDKESDHEVGDPAESVKLSMRATVSGLAYSRSDLVDLAKKSLDANLRPGTASVPGSLGYEEIPTAEGAGSSPATIQVRVWREVYPRLDADLAKRLVRGLEPSTAIATLARDFPLGALPRIRLHPAWWPRMPLLEVRTAIYWPWGSRG